MSNLCFSRKHKAVVLVVLVLKDLASSLKVISSFILLFSVPFLFFGHHE